MFRSAGDWDWNCSTSMKTTMSASKSRATSAGSVSLGWASTQVATLSGSTTVIFLTFLRKIVARSRLRSRSSEEYSPIESETARHRITTFLPSNEVSHGGGTVGSKGWRK